MSKTQVWVFIFCGVLLAENVVQCAEVKYTGKSLRDPFTDMTDVKPVDETALMQQSIDGINDTLHVHTIDGLLQDLSCRKQVGCRTGGPH